MPRAACLTVQVTLILAFHFVTERYVAEILPIGILGLIAALQTLRWPASARWLNEILGKLCLKSSGRCSKPLVMVWPLKKRNPTTQATSGVSLGDCQAVPQNTDRIQKPAPSHELPSSGSYTVPQGYKLSGALSTTSPVVIAGEVVGGSLTANTVVVRPGGVLAAPAAVGSIVVEGEVDAPLLAREGVDVRAGGVIRGPVEAPTLRVAAGGIITSTHVSVAG